MWFNVKAASLFLTLSACSSLSQKESKSPSGGEQEASGDAPISQPESSKAPNSCELGAKKRVDCNDCWCGDSGVWSCTKKECDTETAGPGEYETCDALGFTWVKKDGACILSEWAGCGPTGEHFDSQRDCLNAISKSPELKFMPVASCPAFVVPNEELSRDEACPVGITSGTKCTGNGGPGCDGASCSSLEPLTCKVGSERLVCRPSDFKCG